MIDRFKRIMVEALQLALNDRSSVSLPHGGSLFWEWFMDLHASRSWHMNGPNPISYEEIAAYGRLHHWRFRPDHIAIIRAMDEAFIADFYSKRPQASGETVTRKPSGNLSADLFDAVFG